MSKKSCDSCVFGSLCKSGNACDDYCPCTDDAEDMYIAEANEEMYEEFRKAWNSYENEAEN